MKTLTIRGLPEKVHGQLKERAERNRRSLNQEIIAELVAAAGTGREETAEERVERLMAQVERVRRGLRRPLSSEEIKAGIMEGRR